MILSRTFCNVDKIQHMGEISNIFINGVREIRALENQIAEHSNFFKNNVLDVKKGVDLVLENIK